MTLKQLIDQMVDAALCHAGDHLRRAKVRRAEQDVQQGRFGEAAAFTQILVLHNEYDRRANLVLDCIRRALEANSSPKQDRAVSFESLRTLYNKYVKANTEEITLALLALPQNGKPTFAEHKASVDRKTLAELAFALGQHQASLATTAPVDTNIGSKELRKVAKQAADEAAKMTLSGVNPALRCSKLNPDRGKDEDLIQAFTLERKNHDSDLATFKELARMDIEKSRAKGTGVWMRRNEAVKHSEASVRGESMSEKDISNRAAALKKQYQRVMDAAKRPNGKK